MFFLLFETAWNSRLLIQYMCEKSSTDEISWWLRISKYTLPEIINVLESPPDIEGFAG
jgi:hypothetical protein